MSLFEQILKSRGITPENRAVFLSPDYARKHDPFLLPDMQAAIDRLVIALDAQEKITIYGDYDIDGLTATTLLIDAFKSFGFKNVTAFIPNRFVEGYGLTIDAVERIAAGGTELIVTVDCGSLSHKEIARANELGVDVIVTDHHNVASEQPTAVAVVNPKRLLQDHPERYENYVSKTGTDLYPFLDLPGVGVAFKLVQAMQTVMDGLPIGQEKWLLDLVALGTVCDVVTLIDENRTHVYWGLKVLSQTRRPGLRALMEVAGVRPELVNARSLGFGLGPRMNASGRMETAQYSLDLLTAQDPMEALRIANLLDTMNKARRAEQDEIFKAATIQAEEYASLPVLVVSSPGWNHGIVGIVAAKLLERYKKPTYVIEEMGKESKGSARSYGGFSAADAIRAADDIITKGGGHKLAAGVTLPTKNIQAFRERVNAFYVSQKLFNQPDLLLPKADVDVALHELNEALVDELKQLEPFGSGNPQPILMSSTVLVMNQRKMGADSQHVKLTFEQDGRKVDMIAFNAPAHFFVEPGEHVTVWYTVDVNEWNGRRNVEGQLLHLELATP
ncbi:single-stranded-DNA-specific exonuclease RecJ [Candidatus Saccharibacteria bacterium]|nr:single-stranded-DNA-specific exonuclease RecJ [Candidatus Saccharibacteria bacterium]